MRLANVLASVVIGGCVAVAAVACTSAPPPPPADSPAAGIPVQWQQVQSIPGNPTRPVFTGCAPDGTRLWVSTGEYGYPSGISAVPGGCAVRSQ